MQVTCRIVVYVVHCTSDNIRCTMYCGYTVYANIQIIDVKLYGIDCIGSDEFEKRGVSRQSRGRGSPSGCGLTIGGSPCSGSVSMCVEIGCQVNCLQGNG